LAGYFFVGISKWQKFANISNSRQKAHGHWIFFVEQRNILVLGGSMNNDWKIKTAFGEAQSILAAAWCSCFGILILTAVIYAIAATSGLVGFVAFKWIYYLALWRWVLLKIDSLIWVVFPEANPVCCHFIHVYLLSRAYCDNKPNGDFQWL
jgi:hypothetical protein